MENPQQFPPSATNAGAAHGGSKRRRWLGGLIALVSLVAIVALAWYLTHRAPVAAADGRGTMPGAPGGPAGGPPGAAAGAARGGRGGPPSTVGVAAARKADIPVIIEALGTVTSAANVTVTPQVSGVITQVLYKEGQLVRKGDVLVTIDPQPFQLALAQASAARARDAAQLDAARLLLERYKVLLSQDSIARQTVDTQDALVQQLAGTVALDRANEDSARLNLQWTRIVAPVTGRVGLRPIDAGNFISTGSTTGVATITQVSPIDIAFSIPQVRLPALQQRMAAGAALAVTAWDSGRTRQLEAGTFTTLDNQIDTTTGTVKAKARFKNEAGTLFPNQFVNVRLLLSTDDSAVVVPVTALRHGPNGDYVYVVSADRVVSLRPVTAGISGVNDVAITTGLAIGEQVVTEGGDRLKDGARVQTSADRPAADGTGRRGSGTPGAGSGKKERPVGAAPAGAATELPGGAPAGPPGATPAGQYGEQRGSRRPPAGGGTTP